MIEDFYKYKPYELDRGKKEKIITKELIELTEYHRERCQDYSRFLDNIGYHADEVKGISDIPFFPVRMFKEKELLSIPKDEIFKTMMSSGTTGQKPSKIFLDKDTALMQQKVMTKILNDYWGTKRMPLLVIDSPDVLKDRKQFSARGAAIIGVSYTARETVFVLNEDMSLNIEKLEQFVDKYRNQRFIIFGFTFLVWQYFYKELLKHKDKFDLSEAFLMTGGGWKKLESETVERNDFKKRIESVCGIKHFLDHYDMVEQTGCLYAECECGHYHVSIYSDIIPRRIEDFSPCKIGEEGILQLVSVLPHSYPGHSLISEDIGVILGEDDCPCGRKGKYFKILGRIKNAELRGCSDTYASQFRSN